MSFSGFSNLMAAVRMAVELEADIAEEEDDFFLLLLLDLVNEMTGALELLVADLGMVTCVVTGVVGTLPILISLPLLLLRL